MMKKLHNYPNPCLTCTRVADPENCENKSCRLWQQWFIFQWERIRAYPYYQMNGAEHKPVGVPLGGRHYAHPVQVQAYLKEDPCKKCSCPKDVCVAPCRVRKAWEKAKEEVFQ